MSKLTVLLVLLVTTTVSDDVVDTPQSDIQPYQIPDGKITELNNIPYLVKISDIKYPSPKFSCSGALMKRNDLNPKPEVFLVTTYSCVVYLGPTNYTVTNGNYTCPLYHWLVTPPPLNRKQERAFDFVFIRTHPFCEFDSNNAIPFVPKNTQLPSSVVVSGWDKQDLSLNPKTLFEDVLQRRKCIQSFPKSEHMKRKHVFCIGVEKGSQGHLCEAQIGSPVVTTGAKPFLVGIASWTYESSDQQIYPCVVTNLADPVVNDFLTRYLDAQE